MDENDAIRLTPDVIAESKKLDFGETPLRHSPLQFYTCVTLCGAGVLKLLPDHEQSRLEFAKCSSLL